MTPLDDCFYSHLVVYSYKKNKEGNIFIFLLINSKENVSVRTRVEYDSKYNKEEISFRNLGCPYELVSFNKVLLHTWDKHSMAHNFSFQYKISSYTKRYINLQSFPRQVKSRHCWFFEQHMKYFNTQQAAAEKAGLSVNNPDIQEVDDLHTR